jgi:hypothetical protein
MTKQNKPLAYAAAIAAVIASPTYAQNQNADLEALKKQVQALQEQVETLKEGPKVNPENESLLNQRFFRGKGLTIGFYGEAKYRFPETGSPRFDPHRFVLAPSYQINDWLVFNSELEFEHGGIDESTPADRSRFGGEVELEQMFVDILINEHFNIRSLGVDLVPVGRINKFHEPTVFYSTERPELYREIIPTTWMEPSIGAFGKVVEGLDYQLMVSSGIEDALSGSASPGITGTGGFRGSRPPLRTVDENSLAYSGRLHYNGISGLDASASTYITKVEGFKGNTSFVSLWDVEALYRVPHTGLELRGDFAYWHIDDPKALLANNDASVSNDVGERMYGWYTEAAYHFWPDAWKEGKGSDMDLVPFVRYSQIVTQSELPSGTNYNNTGAANRDFLTIGLAYFLNQNFVVKADYRKNLDGTAATERSDASQDYFQMGVGVSF